MRLRTRVAVHVALVTIAAVIFAGCSSHPELASLPAVQAQSSTSQLRRTLTANAFPIAISAIPITMSAYPVSLSALPACAPSNNTTAVCHSQYRSDIAPNPNPALPPSLIAGHQPGDLQSAYGLTRAAATRGGDQIVAVIVAYSAPALESDLGVYRAAFGLPPCTVAGGCLSFFDTGGGPAAYDPGWATEATIDAEMVSAACPLCKIMVVRATDASFVRLTQAVDKAAGQHASVISNSYSVPETSDVQQYASHYQLNGIPVTAGAGDQGYGVGFPASVPTVTAVGGTSLVHDPNFGWASAVWPATGSGCSTIFKKPAWQTDTGCSMRTLNDLAVVADPATGVAGYVSPAGGWAVFGGTSVGAPLVAGMYALAGPKVSTLSNIYLKVGAFSAVTPRSNGLCTPPYLCNGGPGYNGPSGLGTPRDLSAFGPGPSN